MNIVYYSDYRGEVLTAGALLFSRQDRVRLQDRMRLSGIAERIAERIGDEPLRVTAPLSDHHSNEVNPWVGY